MKVFYKVIREREREREGERESLCVCVCVCVCVCLRLYEYLALLLSIYQSDQQNYNNLATGVIPQLRLFMGPPA